MTEKKIFDIMPPQAEENQPEAVLPIEEEVIKKTPDVLPPRSASPRSLKLWLFLSFLVILLAGSILLFLKFFPQVSVVVWLKTNSLNFEEMVSVSQGQKGVALAEKILPGRIVSEEVSFNRDFPATGQSLKEEKAQGLVKIFNDYSAAAQPLVVSTRLVSSEGKLFRLAERVVVPGKTNNGAGVIEAKVIADLPGQEYNIGSTTFSIPGFAGTPKYTTFYAKSSAAMKGGFKGQVATVTAQDLIDAKKESEAQARDRLSQSLRDKALPGFLVIPSTLLEIISSTTDRQALDQVESLNYQAKARQSAVILSESDLNEMGQSFCESRLLEKNQVVPQSLKISSELLALDSVSAKASLKLGISCRGFEDLDLGSLQEQLLGKSLREVEINFQGLAPVARATIKVFPSFFKTLPQDPGKVKIEIKFD